MALFQIKINNKDLVVDADKTFLGSDTPSGLSALTVQNINRFAINQILLIGEIGSEGSEIVKTSSGTAPSGTTVALAAATTQTHLRGTVVYIIQFDQYELTNAATETGSKVALTTTLGSGLIAIDPEQDSTLYNDSEYSTGGYFIRKKNSITSNFSGYSGYITYGGLPDNAIGAIKTRALLEIGEKISDLITDAFLNAALAEGRRMLDQNPATLRWSFRTKFGQVLGQMLSGEWSIAAPADLRDRNTHKNILSIRMANQNRPVVYQDRVRFNQNYLNVVHTTVASNYTHGSTSLVLTSTHDLDASGAITIANEAVGDGLISIAYSANNKNTNTLTITATSSRDISAGTDVWQRAIFGLPTAYTISDGFIYFDTPVKLDYDGQDAKIDYYSIIPTTTNDASTFDEPFYDLYVSWLKWKIKYLKSNGKIDRDSDSDYKDFITGAANVIGQEVLGQRINFIPDIEGFLSATE